MRHSDSEKMIEPSFPGAFETPSRCYYENLLCHLPLLTDCADHLISSGIFNIWSRLLGCPPWVTQDTLLADGVPLPILIRQEDDLIILANFLDNIGPKSIISGIMDNKSALSSAKTYARISSCPNGIELINFVRNFIIVQHKFSSISITIKRKFLFIEIFFDRALGAVGHFYEMFMALFFCRAINSLRYDGIVKPLECWLTCELGLKQSPWLEHVTESADFPVSQSENSSRIIVSFDWMAAPNSRYDASLWGEALEALSLYANRNDVSISLLRIRELVRGVLIRDHRPPRLKEIADLERVSERTFARRIASLGTCYQDIVDGVRADMAKVQLLDGNSTVDLVASRLGFSHSSSFARAFTGWQGLSPTKWRAIQTAPNKGSASR